MLILILQTLVDIFLIAILWFTYDTITKKRLEKNSNKKLLEDTKKMKQEMKNQEEQLKQKIKDRGLTMNQVSQFIGNIETLKDWLVSLEDGKNTEQITHICNDVKILQSNIEKIMETVNYENTTFKNGKDIIVELKSFIQTGDISHKSKAQDFLINNDNSLRDLLVSIKEFIKNE